jgi:hypothetical protein
MADFATYITQQPSLTEDQQKKAGQPIQGDMDQDHKNFCTTVSELLESGAIDVTKPESFLNQAVYDTLPDEWKAKTDLTIVNMATLLDHIYGFYKSKQTPDACPQLATMIEQLWEMKQRIEAHGHDVFKF